MPECSNNSPTTGGRTDRHRCGAKYFYPQRHGEHRRPQKFEPGRQMIESAGFGAGEKREGDDAHCFLGVIGAVTMRHPCSAHDLRLSKKQMDEVRCEPMQQYEQQKHYQSAKNESRDRRGNHRQNHFWPDTGVPFDDRPISFCGCEDRKSTRLNSSHGYISYAVFCLKKKKKSEHLLCFKKKKKKQKIKK